MVETLNNRLNDGKLNLEDIGLVIIDEAHYNSFRKLFKFFDNCFILGVTATPLSSNIKLPMKDNYKELIVGDNISTLIKNGFLASAEIYNYDVSLTTLKIGINGDYTVKSSEALYTNTAMQSKLLQMMNCLKDVRHSFLITVLILLKKSITRSSVLVITFDI